MMYEKGMKNDKKQNNSPATIKGGKANMGEVGKYVKECTKYSKSYGSVGGKLKAQK